jgi:ribosome-binding factor A
MPLAGTNTDDILAGLKRSAPYLKSRVAREVVLRHVPNLSFTLDRAFDSAAHITELLSRPDVARDLEPRSEDADDA